MRAIPKVVDESKGEVYCEDISMSKLIDLQEWAEEAEKKNKELKELLLFTISGNTLQGAEYTKMEVRINNALK